jgi:hypothetical protein
MSELIDSIYDVSKIQAESDKISAIVEATKKVIEEARSAKDINGLSDASKKLNDNMVAGKKAVEEYTAVEKQLIAQQKQLETVEAKRYAVSSDVNREVEKNKKLLAGQIAINKQKAIIDDKEAGTLEKLTAQNKLLDIEKKKLNLSTVDGSARLKEIIALEDKNNQELAKGKNADQQRTASIGQYKKQIGELVSGFKNGEIGTKQLASGFAKLGKQMIVSFVTNPIFLVLGAIVLLIKGVADAFGRSEERTMKLQMATAQFKPILVAMGDAFEVVADAVIKTVGFLGKAYSAVAEFLGITPKGSADRFVEAEKLKQKAILETRTLNEDASKQEAIIAEQREIIADKEEYTYKQRVDALKIAGEAEKQLASDRQKIAEMNLEALQAEAALDDNNAEMNDKISAAIVAVNNAKKESANVGRKLAREGATLARENRAEIKAEANAFKAAEKEKADAKKEAAQKILNASRMLKDSELAIMIEGEAKQIAISDENFKRQLEDLEKNGQLTKELQSNLETAHQMDLQKIKDDFAKQAKEKDEADMDKYLANFESNLKKETDILALNLKQKENDLKKEFSFGKLSRKEKADALLKLQDGAAKEANEKSIEFLQKELANAELTADKRAEFSNRLKDLQVQNENAVLDATIEANDKKVEADKLAAEKRKEIGRQIFDAGMDLFASIGDFQKQQSENRLEEIEKEQAANDEMFANRQANLDNSIMSDETRAMAQKKIDEDQAKRQNEIADKIQAEKIKQAKWEKAQALVSAITSTANAVISALGVAPPLGFILAALVGAAGAIQIATIASQKIPAYKDGTLSTKNEIALWGEERTEIAVTRAGDIMFAEKPTVSKFDAGTRIYKSVEDFERNVSMHSQYGKSFEFDYEKMAEKIPQTTINLDANGLWGIINREKNREIMINQTYKLG